MPRLKRKTPCDDCPFRRNALAGWTGDATPAEHLVYVEKADGEAPCHLNVDYSDPQWQERQLPNAALCAGGLQYLANTHKRPRDPAMAAIVQQLGRNPDVFDYPWEFLSHHLRREVTIDQALEMMRVAQNNLIAESLAEQGETAQQVTT